MNFSIFNPVKIFLLFAGIFPLISCARIHYYSQSIAGQWEIIANRKPINEILADKNISSSVKEKLAPIHDIRKFSHAILKLPDNNSYLTYSDIKREYVVWNIIATPKLSLEPVQWCFLIAGCLNYQGFFDKESALRQAELLRKEGYDVFVGGVSAYSTLGWFDDPILNTMLKKDTNYLVKVIFHELAHQRIYIKDDTEFNEAFAETVAIAGMQQWLSKYQSRIETDNFNIEQNAEDRFVSLVLKTRNQLENIYNSGLPDQLKLQNKLQILTSMRETYYAMQSHQDVYTNYDEWFENELNNAKIAAVVTYRNLIPGFNKLLEKTGNNFDTFYRLVMAMEKCSISDRRAILESGVTEFQC